VRRRYPAAAVGATAAVVASLLGSRWQRNWGATPDEVHRRLPGDELVAEPAAQSTRAITIDAPVESVWRWVIQLGADRGGFYSYDWLENAFGLGIHSSDVIVPEWQTREIGDLVYANDTGAGGWYVMDVRQDELLVLKMADVATGRPASRARRLRWEFLWTFGLDRRSDGSTRLLVRERAGFGRTTTRLLMAPLGPVSFVMTRRMLQGIKRRAEASVTHGDDRSTARMDADAPRAAGSRS
jgi:hypothetical protein